MFFKSIIPRRCLFLCVAGFLFSVNASAQDAKHRLGASVTYRGYLSNYEYFNPIVPGYTLYGNLIEPGFTFSVDTSWTLFGGAWLQSDFGGKAFKQFKPNFYLEHKRRNWNIRFGNVTVYNNEFNSPWLYDPDRFINTGILNGTRVNTTLNFLKSNSWIAWRRMIYSTGYGQEKIEAGSFATFSLADSSSSWIVDLPLRFIVMHSGGQIGNISTTSRVITELAGETGLTIGKKFKNGLVEELTLNGLVGICNNADDRRIGNGMSYYSSINTQFKKGFSAEAGFWYAQDYFVATGSPLYQSRSSEYANEESYHSTRKIASLALGWNKKISGVDVNVWLQPHYDFEFEKLEYAYRLRVTFPFTMQLLHD